MIWEPSVTPQPNDAKMPPDLKQCLAPVTDTKPKLISLIPELSAGQKKREIAGSADNPAVSQKTAPKKQKFGAGTCDDCGDEAR